MSDLVKDSDGLTARQKRLADMWIKAKIAGATFTQAELAKAAGYAGDLPSLEVQASRCLALPHVAAYIKQRAREHMSAEAFDVVLELSALRRSAASESVRKDILLDQAKSMGLLHADGGPSGPAIAVQITLTDPAAGAQMAQLLALADNRKVIQGVAVVEHSPTEGEGERKAPARRSRLTPPPGQAQPAEAPRGVKNRARKSPAGPHARLPPKKLRGGKSGGGSGG